MTTPVERTKRFDREARAYIGKDRSRAQAVAQAIRRFEADPNDPQLKLEKLVNRPEWSIRVNYSIRIILSRDENRFVMTGIGDHDHMYR